jgi:hypothetical protein
MNHFYLFYFLTYFGITIHSAYGFPWRVEEKVKVDDISVKFSDDNAKII